VTAADAVGAFSPPRLAKPARRWRRLADLFFLDGFRAAPGWMSGVTAMILLGSIAGTCYPLGYRLLVDGALEDSPRRLMWGVVVVGVLMSLGWVLTTVGATEAMALSDRISVYRTNKVIGLISNVAGIEHLERPEYLTEIERLNSNRRQLSGAPRQLLSNIASAARIVALLVLLASVSPWLLLLPVCALPPMVADRLAKRITKRAENDMAHSRRLASMLFGLTSEAATAGEIRAYGLGPHLAGEHARLIADVDRRSAAEAVRVLVVQGTGWLLYAAGLMAAIAFVVVRASGGAVSLGTVLMAVSLIRRSRRQLASAAQSSGALVATLATADRLFWLEDHAAEQAARAGTADPPASLTQGIAFRDVTFRYPGTDRDVLAGFDVELPAGSTVALVGENGSGKTTVVKLLLGLYQPDAGAILIDGEPLAAISPTAWRERCTAAFQDFARFHLPAVESVGVAEIPRVADVPAAAAALDRAGAGELVMQLPDGLATEVGNTFTGGHGLSDGQWQKLALGRAMRRTGPLLVGPLLVGPLLVGPLLVGPLLVGPLLVVLDEPTASLDAQAEHELFERYAAAAHESGRAGAITVLVSHRFSTVRMADLIIFLEAGRAAEVGSHAGLLDAGGRYAELFDLQAAGYR
jgi:ATP-binding cassette, subfamily B, bacterial